MVSGYGHFIFADDFDVVMATLEEDESVEEQFLETIQEVSINYLLPESEVVTGKSQTEALRY